MLQRAVESIQENIPVCAAAGSFTAGCITTIAAGYLHGLPIECNTIVSRVGAEVLHQQGDVVASISIEWPETFDEGRWLDVDRRALSYFELVIPADGDEYFTGACF